MEGRKREREDAHASKRARVAAARAERPHYVTAATSLRSGDEEVERVGGMLVDVRRPGGDGLLEGNVGLRGVLSLGAGDLGGGASDGGRVVLCFLGGTVEHLRLLR